MVYRLVYGVYTCRLVYGVYAGVWYIGWGTVYKLVYGV